MPDDNIRWAAAKTGTPTAAIAMSTAMYCIRFAPNRGTSSDNTSNIVI